MLTSLPARNEVNPDYTWNAGSLYPTPKDWETEVENILDSMPELKRFQGGLGESASALADALQTQADIMVRDYLLKTNSERDFQISVIEEAMSNYYRYFFIMPTLARFELETHTRIEEGQPLTADTLINLMADLFSEAYGDTVDFNREQIGMTWARFGHMYSDYYVYQYATGISGAQALSSRILRAEPGAVNDYLGFLKSGASDYPLKVLKKAGVDLTSTGPVEEAFAIMADYVDRLEILLN